MNSSWKRFLSQYDAAFDDGGVKDFGDPLAEGRAAAGSGVLCDLSHRGLVKVEGEDAFTFLQGQLSCDLNHVTPRRSRLGAWCSPKGRVLVLFRVVHAESVYLLELPASQVETFLPRLKMYVMRARVSLNDVSDEMVRLGLAGDSAAGPIETVYGSAPESPDEVTAAGDARLIRLHGRAPRYEFLGPQSAAEELWRTAAGTLRPAGRRIWSLLEILAGVPEITHADEHLPQTINLDVLGGLSFEKGCYVGQEIIARIHHLGRLKRRMYLVGIDDEELPAAGARVVEAASGSEAGQIVSSAPRFEADGFAALAVLRIDATRDGDLRLGSVEGPRVEVLDLPYAVSGANG